MSDPTEFLTCAVLAGVFLGVWLAIRECSNATMQGGRAWWKKAIFLAEQRQSYREFCKDLRTSERMDVD